MRSFLFQRSDEHVLERFSDYDPFFVFVQIDNATYITIVLLLKQFISPNLITNSFNISSLSW